LLYNEYLEFHGVKAAAAWCYPTNAIFSYVVEERAEVYLCFSICTLNFMRLKRPALCAVQLMPYLVTKLKKSRRIPLLFNEYIEFHGVKEAGAWRCPTNAIFSDEGEGRADVYLCCTMSILKFMR
jgi:hypothetical protein